MKKRIKVIPGGTSAGKTFAILPILINKAINEPNTSISVVSQSMPHIRKGAMRDFLNIMKMTNRYVDEHWNITNSIYTFSNGSYIEFFSADNGDRLRGSRRKILFCNEINFIQKDAYLQLAMRTSNDIYLDYNPTHRFWIDDVLKSDEAEKLTLTYRDNEALSDTIIDFLEEKRELAKTSDYWRNWCDVYLDGKEGKLEGTIFSNFSVIDVIPEDARLIAYGLDFGYTNHPSALIAVYKLDDEVILDEVFYRSGLTNNDIANIMKQEDIKGEIYADSAEPKSIREIRNYGFRIMPTKKGKDSILYGIQLMQEQNIYITKRSHNLKDEFNKYMWRKDKEGNELNVPIDAFNHAIDAVRYVFLMKFGKKSTGTPFVIGGR